MSLVAILLVLIAAVFHASWNMLAKRSADRLTFFWLISLASVIVYAPLFVFTIRDHPIPPDGWVFILATGAINCVYIASLARAYHYGALSVAYPIARGTGASLVPLLAIPLLGERVSLGGALGIGMIVAGILTLHLDALRHLLSTASSPIGIVNQPSHAWRGTMFAVLTGVLIASYSLVDKAGIRHVNTVVYNYLIFAGIVVGLAPFVLPRRIPAIRQELRSGYRSVIFSGIAMFATYFIILGAMRLGQVSYVVPLRETSVVVASVWGVVFLKERFSRRALFSSALIALGVISIATLG